MYLIYNTIEDVENDLLKINATAIQQLACFDSGHMFNVITKQREYILDKPESELTSDKYPMFGYNAKTQKVNTKEGYTTAWDIPVELIDGRYAIKKPERTELLYNLTPIEEIEDIAPFIDVVTDL